MNPLRESGVKNRLGPKALKVLLYVLQHQSITVRDISSKFTFATGTVFNLLKKLKSAGLVSWEEGKSRTIRPTCSITLFKEIS